MSYMNYLRQKTNAEKAVIVFAAAGLAALAYFAEYFVLQNCYLTAGIVAVSWAVFTFIGYHYTCKEEDGLDIRQLVGIPLVSLLVATFGLFIIPLGLVLGLGEAIQFQKKQKACPVMPEWVQSVNSFSQKKLVNCHKKKAA